MLVLGIESTCDETSAAIVRNGSDIISHVIHSQTEVHRPYNGVYPELASRCHADTMMPTIETALQKANLSGTDIDLIAVAHGPGLIGSLLVGLNTAKALSLGWNCPFIGINHVEAHLYAAMMPQKEPLFPAIGAVLSGGHTFLVQIFGFGDYQLIGSTVDDAIGEAFDKVAAMLDLPYPGGPEIEKQALHGNPEAFAFKAGVVKGRPWDFSFSGLKTNVLYTLQGKQLSVPDVAASFQAAACQSVVDKIAEAAQQFPCKAIYLGGGVAMNRYLRSLLEKKNLSAPVFWPTNELCMDNAAMIAGLGFHTYAKRGCGDQLDLEPFSRYSLTRAVITFRSSLRSIETLVSATEAGSFK